MTRELLARISEILTHARYTQRSFQLCSFSLLGNFSRSA
jgi:hypothetical protein